MIVQVKIGLVIFCVVAQLAQDFQSNQKVTGLNLNHVEEPSLVKRLTCYLGSKLFGKYSDHHQVNEVVF